MDETPSDSFTQPAANTISGAFTGSNSMNPFSSQATTGAMPTAIPSRPTPTFGQPSGSGRTLLSDPSAFGNAAPSGLALQTGTKTPMAPPKSAPTFGQPLGAGQTSTFGQPSTFDQPSQVKPSPFGNAAPHSFGSQPGAPSIGITGVSKPPTTFGQTSFGQPSGLAAQQ